MLIVCVAGLVPGLLLARAAVPALLAINPSVAKTLGVVAIDWRVQAFSAVVAILTAVLASAVPALRAMRGQVSTVLAATALRTTGSPRAVRLQRALVSIEVALCVALLMAGAVVIGGLQELSRRGPGYESSGVLTAQIRLPEASYRTPGVRVAVVDRLLSEIQALPGVVSVGMTQNAFLPKFSFHLPVTCLQPIRPARLRLSAVHAGRRRWSMDEAPKPQTVSGLTPPPFEPGAERRMRIVLFAVLVPVVVTGFIAQASIDWPPAATVSMTLSQAANGQLVEIRHASGTAVLSGEFRSRVDSLGNTEKDAELTDQAGRTVIGEVELEIPAPGRDHRRPELEVDVIHLQPRQRYTVVIDDKTVGTFITDDRGAADLELQEGETSSARSGLHDSPLSP